MITFLAQILPGYTSDQPASNPIFGSKGAAPGGAADTGFYKYFAPDWWLGSGGKLATRIMLFAIVGAGLFFFARLLLGGYAYLTSAGDSAKVQGATKEITNALIGLLLVISAFFIGQIFQVIFGISII